MKDMREYESGCTDLNTVRDRLFGVALLVFAVVALGAYSFAAGEGASQPQIASVDSGSAKEIRTTPDDGAHHEMPPPVEQVAAH